MYKVIASSKTFRKDYDKVFMKEEFVFISFHKENGFPQLYRSNILIVKKRKTGTHLPKCISNCSNFRRCERHLEQRELFPIPPNINLSLADP